MSGLRNHVLKNNIQLLKPEILIEGLLYGPILRKDQKIEFDTCDYISNEIRSNELNFKEENPYELDGKVTSLAVYQLLTILSENKQFYSEILRLLQIKYAQYEGKRYFGDSQIHIIKLRIMQIFHLLIDFLNEKDLNTLSSCLYKMLVNESQQPSIKILIQWLLIRNYLKLDNVFKIVDNLIVNSKQLSGTSITSIFPILYHLTKNENANFDLISHCIDYLMPYTMGQQFNIRYIAQLTIKKIYENTEIIKIKHNYASIYKTVVDVINQTSTDKTLDNVLTFTDLTLSLETIYYDIPRLTNVSYTKWLPVEYFENILLVPLISDISLKELQPKIFIKNSIALDLEIENMNVQKKIDTTAINNFIDEYNIKPTIGNLIVVACLIDRAPNLGGLSRTCEVFGVKQYVLNNIQFMKNKEYQSLSMSSEKWIDTIEVKVENLASYLMEMKNKNYKIIGAEQTADSQMLDKFHFNKDTVLLLGNEKEGIPSNLIHLLDECIEIPQFGQIRSLNVHVAGALFIWEYAKQYCKNI